MAREDDLYWVENINTNGCVRILMYTEYVNNDFIPYMFFLKSACELKKKEFKIKVLWVNEWNNLSYIL
jgi:hypothetical protein